MKNPLLNTFLVVVMLLVGENVEAVYEVKEGTPYKTDKYNFTVYGVDSSLIYSSNLAYKYKAFIGSEAKAGYGYIAGTAAILFETKKQAENFITEYQNTDCIKYGHKYKFKDYDDGARIETCEICNSRKYPSCINHEKLEFFYSDIHKSNGYYVAKSFPEC